MTRVALVDPSAFTPAYDHALASSLGRAGAEVALYTSRFAYGEVPPPDTYRMRELFYRRPIGAPGSTARRAFKLAAHVPGMLALRRAARAADVVHFQWVDVPWLDADLLPPRPRVLTAHDLLPREPRFGQARAQRRLFDRMDALVVHSAYGRQQLVDRLGVAPEKVHIIHHGAFAHVVSGPRAPLPPELGDASGDAPVVLFAGLLRPYKGLDTLLAAWPQVTGGQLWIAGRPMMELEALRARADERVRWVTRYLSEGEMAALLQRADIVVLPYARTERFDQSGVLAGALAFGVPSVISEIGGFPEIAATGAARLVAPGDHGELAGALSELLAEPDTRARMAAAARAASAPGGPYSWEEAARLTLELYAQVSSR
ncbi:MAG: glycosyltransferase family 4 protein [Solirubrobacteraceae bacterium]